MSRPWIVAAAAGMVLLANACGPRPGPAGSGGNPSLGTVRGHVLLYPCAPVERVTSPCAGRPAAGVEVDLTPEAGGQMASTKTGPDGSYSIQLQPGTYRASVKTLRPLQGVRTLAVLAGKVVTADFLIDSGIR